MCNVTHILLVIGKGKDVMGLPFTNVQCHLLAVGHSDETPFHKMCNVAHNLLFIRDVERLPFTMSLTCFWS
jgi:hypothetical protein